MNLTIPSQPRDAFGKNASYRIRQTGRIPAILYGEGQSNLPIVLDKKDIIKILKSETGLNTLFKISVPGGERDVMIKDVQIDPISDQLIHADLIQIDMNKAVRVEVPVELIGEAVGVKTEGGFIDFMTRELMIECLPALIPERLTVNVSELHLHQSIKVGEVALPEGIKLITDPGAVVALVQVPHEEKAEAAPVAEEGAEVAAAAPAEPEVVKKERAEKPESEK
ncbi:MAG: 50S ribosomal protein L25 [Candidatus Aminicenantes bacterium]|nr:50S ribosomal protein L25 [Candidatus Aminicenantes bacterium]